MYIISSLKEDTAAAPAQQFRVYLLQAAFIMHVGDGTRTDI